MSDEPSPPSSGPVTRADLEAHLASGTTLDLSGRDEADRTIAGSLLREVLIDKDLARDPRGLTVVAAHIPHDLDLSYCTVPAPLRLWDAKFQGVVTLQEAIFIGRLDLSGAELNGKTSTNGDALVADRMRVNGHAFLQRLRATGGAIRLRGATITGQLNLTDAKLNGKNEDGIALFADRMQVGASAFLGNLEVAQGAVHLGGATITGQLNLTGAKLNGGDENCNALFADRLQVGASLVMRRMTVSKGAVRLAGVTIDGELNLTGAELNGKDNFGNALVGNRMTVSGNALLGKLTVSEGVVRLAGVSITGQLNLTAAELNGRNVKIETVPVRELRSGEDSETPRYKATGETQSVDELRASRHADAPKSKAAEGEALVADGLDLGRAELSGDHYGNALIADGMQVGADAFLSQLKAPHGGVRLEGVTITGDLELSGAVLTGANDNHDALFADRLQVRGNTLLTDMVLSQDGSTPQPKGVVSAKLSLRDGRLGTLIIEKQPLPHGGWNRLKRLLSLGRAVAFRRGGWHRHDSFGLQYDQIDFGPDGGALQGAHWLANQTGGHHIAQPYWQLAEYYARVGNESAARRIRTLSNVQQARAHPPWSWPRFLYGLTTGFGYYPFLALFWVALLIGISSASINAHRSDFVPTRAPALSEAPAVSGSAATSQKPVNNSTCDARYPCFNPILYATDTVVPVISLGQQDTWRIETSQASAGLQRTLLVAKALGWILTTLLVGGIGGLLRRG